MMAEYIERGAAIKVIQDNPHNMAWQTIKAIVAVEDIPAANVVEVVRCKECRNFGEDVGMSKDGVWARCYLHQRIMCEKDFCSYGEKMDGKGENNG